MGSLKPAKAFQRAFTPPGTGGLEAQGIQADARNKTAAEEAAKAGEAAKLEQAKLANLRATEEAKAKDERIRSIQRQLGLETLQRSGGQFGFRSLLGGLGARRSLLGTG